MAKNHTTVAEIHENDQHNEAYSATFCVQDDKIRIYCGRVERETFNFLRQNKFVSTPKQSCDFVAVWSPNAEDIALAMISEEDDIGDEDTSPEERAIDRAERFAGYRDKRRSEAHRHADNYDAGPNAFGNQNRGRAERQAARHERHRGNALSQWSKAEYWQGRTAGVIGHALHKCDARTRRGRILTIEADMRRATEGGRWHQHLQHRLNYENAMLVNEGGQASEVEMVVGGFIRYTNRWGKTSEAEYQIAKINRSPVTKRVTSVEIVAPRSVHRKGQLIEEVGTVLVNIERQGEDIYRAPTPEELEAFNSKQKARKAAKPTIPTINPTDEDAQALQDIWNAEANAQHGDAAGVVPVKRMTQSEFSGGLKHDYVFIHEKNIGGQLVKLRMKRGGGFYNYSAAYQVIILTDKPQKPFPAGWNTPTPTVTPEPEPVIEPQEAPEPEPAECNESTELETVAAGCLF
jgi:hypothetical protein